MNKRPRASKRPDGGPQGLALQRRFFKRLGTDQPFRQLFEHLHGVYFFAKDTRSRLMAATPPIVERLGGKEEKDIIGASDDEFFPPQIGDSFVRDDRWVIETEQPLIGRVEIWYSEQHVFDWFVTKSSIVRGQLLQHGRPRFTLFWNSAREESIHESKVSDPGDSRNVRRSRRRGRQSAQGEGRVYPTCLPQWRA